ncbi:MAG: hypothetical protein MK211_09210 [Flavobacteriales bacterium]|nr:hypothetical protein [Flavobacteriales bacterium]
MKYVLTILLVLVIAGTCVGFYIKPTDYKTGELIIGLSIALGVFILMPLFIYHRWKNRSVKEYMLTKENIEKMRDFSKDKKL